MPLKHLWRIASRSRILWRIKDESCIIIPPMGTARCAVSFTDSDGIAHTAYVQAESVFEAVALAVAEFQQDQLVPRPESRTEFTVAIERPPVEHRICLSQIEKWAERPR